MILDFFASPFLTLVLCCITPSLAFIGVNIERFTTKQSNNTLFLCLACALILSPLFIIIPLHFKSLFISILFFILSEQFLSAIFKKPSHKWRFLVIFSIFTTLITWGFGYLTLNCLFILYAALSCVDIYKNYKRPKESLFRAENFKVKPIRVDENFNIKLKQKNDIFILFWESMHGREAINTLYDFDDPDLYDYFEQNNFTLYPNASSTARCTLTSLNTLLNMTANNTFPNHAPAAMQILNANGYEIQLFDNIVYSFQNIMQYANYYHMKIPNYVIKLLDFAVPFFTQSKFLMYFVRKIDPFCDYKVVNNTLKNDFKQRLTKKYNKPQCYIIHMGAQHSHHAYHSWEKFESWKPWYRGFYTRASKQLREITDTILTHNPNAIIAAMGDHGAHGFRHATRGNTADPLVNVLDKGLSPFLVAMDMASILLAIRFPNTNNKNEQLRSPSNLFRHIFLYLGAENNFLKDVSSNNIFGAKNPYLITKNGKILEKWEKLTGDNALDYISEHVHGGNISHVFFEETVRSLNSYEQLNNAIIIYEKARTQFPNNSEIRSLFISQLLKVGKINHAKEIATALLKEHYFSDYIYIQALQGHHIVAQSLLEDKYTRIKYPEELRAKILCLAGEKEKALEAAEKHFQFSLKHLKLIPEDDFFEALFLCINHIETSGEIQKAWDIYEQMILESADIPKVSTSHLLLASRTLNLTEYSKIMNTILMSANKAILYLFHLGLIDQQGKINKVIEFVEENHESLCKIPSGKIQLGLLAIRLNIKHPLFEPHKKDAQKHLQETKALLISTNLFDETWYKEKYGHLIGTEDALTHYLHHRLFLLLDPNPFFNSMYLCMNNHALFYAGGDLLVYFLAKNAEPSLYFNADQYLAKNPNLFENKENILVHYYSKLSDKDKDKNAL